jgi:hypothetical protein
LDENDQIEFNNLKVQIDPAAREAAKARGKSENKILTEINENALNSGPAYEQLAGVEQAVEELGPLGQGAFVGNIPFIQNVSTAAQTLNSQSTKDALQFVNQTKGAVSDREMTMFRQASVGTDKNIEFNRNYIAAARATLIRQQQQQQFFNAYFTAYGTLEGAFGAFKKYADDNPIFQWNNNEVTLLKTPDDVEQDQSYLNYIAEAPKNIRNQTQQIFDLQESDTQMPQGVGNNTPELTYNPETGEFE